MKILFITNNNTPDRINTGGGQRSYHICKGLLSLGDLDVIEISDKETEHFPIDLDFNYLRRINIRDYQNNKISKFHFPIVKLFKSIINKDYFFPRYPEIENLIKEIIKEKKYDLIFCRYLTSATMTGLIGSKNLIIDFDDDPIESFKIMTKLSKVPILGKIYQNNLKKYYKSITNKLPLSFLSNKRYIKYPNQSFLPNVPFVNKKNNNDNTLNQPEINPVSLLFIGSLGYGPNYTGLKTFIKNVWPKIKHKIPSLDFYIIGKGLPINLIKDFEKYPGIHLLGHVDDLNPYFNHCGVYVSPIYQGAGTNIKILEAMYFGIPIVTTPEGANGFNEMIQDGENILIAKNSQEFTDKINLLFSNPKLKQNIKENGKKALINYKYTSNEFSNILQSKIKETFKF